MAMFTTKLIRRQVTLSPFSAEQMRGLGQAMADTITSRIQSATNVRDQAAKPLTPKYAARKIARGTGQGRFPVRNWTFRDVTLKSIKVKSASEDRVIVGLVSLDAVNIVNGISRYDQMWGTSPKDTEVLHAAVLQMLRQHRIVRWVKTGRKATA